MAASHAQRGVRGVAWGISPGITLTGVIASFEAQSVRLSKEADVASIRDSNGDECTKIYHNQKRMVTIEVIPSGATLAAAQTNSIIPEPGTVVTIADSSSNFNKDADFTSLNSGKYLCERAEKTRGNTSEVRITMELSQNKANDLAGDAIAAGS